MRNHHTPMKKKVYRYILFTAKSHVTKADAIELGYKSKSELCNEFVAYKDKRDERRMAKEESLKSNHSVREDYLNKRGSEIRELCASIYCPASALGKKVYSGDTLSIEVEKELDWDGYSRSCKYPKANYTLHITIPDGGVKVAYFDGIPTVYNRKKAHLGYTFVFGWTITHGRGVEYRITPCVVVGTASGVYAHGTNSTDAVKSLEKKIKLEEKREQKRLADMQKQAESTRLWYRDRLVSAGFSPDGIRADDIITPDKYRELTGACQMGTGLWLDGHGYKWTDSITAKQLRSILRPSDYGYTAFVSCYID